MSNTAIDTSKAPPSSEFFTSRLDQPQQQAPIFALLNDKRDDNSINHKTMSSFLPTPDTPVTSASSLTLLKTPFGSHRRTSGPPTGAADKERPYACTECSQRFSRPHNLKSHLTTHSSERPFQCNVCNSFFRRHHDLKRHKKLHTGERPYQCKNCHRSFARLDALNRHCRAEGGTACNNAATKHHHQEHQRPIVPQLHIAHPASQPLPSIFFHRHHPSPSTSPSPPTHTTSPNISPPAATKTILSAPLSSSKRTLILPSFKDPWEENTQLRHELAYWKAKAAQMSELQSQLHDLQVENKVLRSVIMDARPDNT